MIIWPFPITGGERNCCLVEALVVTIFLVVECLNGAIPFPPSPFLYPPYLFVELTSKVK